jgi:hypothetical protein
MKDAEPAAKTAAGKVEMTVVSMGDRLADYLVFSKVVE